MPSLKNQLEALLFASGKAMEEEQLASIIGVEKKAVKAALKTLVNEYAARDTAIKLYNEGTSWKLLVHDEHVPLVRKIVADTELSRATMETLAVIAYHQPKVLQSKVADLRGGNVYEQIAELERLGFVNRTKEGRSFSLKITEKFFDYFDVEGEKGIKQLFKSIKQPLPKEQQKRLGQLDVVAIADEQKPATGKLGDLEVIDEPEDGASASSDAASRESAPDAPPTAKLERDVAAQNTFLSKLDAQIEELARRNDERNADPLFKTQEQAPPTDGAIPVENVPENDSEESVEVQSSTPEPVTLAPESPVSSPAEPHDAKPKRPHKKPAAKNI